MHKPQKETEEIPSASSRYRLVARTAAAPTAFPGRAGYERRHRAPRGSLIFRISQRGRPVHCRRHRSWESPWFERHDASPGAQLGKSGRVGRPLKTTPSSAAASWGREVTPCATADAARLCFLPAAPAGANGLTTHPPSCSGHETEHQP